MGRDLVERVTGGGVLALLPLAGAALYLAGLPGLLGVLAGGGVALGNLVWLSAGSRRTLGLMRAGRIHPLWLLNLGLRHLGLFAVVGILIWTRSVHPLALIAGLSVLPPVLIVQALRAVARDS